jgi:sugar phosphate isomerase/epimerase
VKADNLGINFDPANLIMYGKANPIDALDVIGKYINGVHAKDGEYPTDGYFLGVEKPLGQGKVDIGNFIKKLFKTGYNGPVTIEREISGDEQKRDILAANKLLHDINLG